MSASLLSSLAAFTVLAADVPPGSRGLNLVFLADGYLSREEFDHDADVLFREMRRTEPWNSFSSFNLYRVRPPDIDLCRVVTENERKAALRCDAAKVNHYVGALGLGRFKLIVLSRRDFQSWANVARAANSGVFMSLPRSPPGSADEAAAGLLFLHLLGHAFGLKDEEVFVIAKAGSAAHVPDGPNCAPDLDTARRWWGDLFGKDPSVGYFAGCAGSELFVKPSTGSLMNLNDLAALRPVYGPVSERYLRKLLRYCFSEPPPSPDADPEFFARFPGLRDCARP